MRHHLIVPQPDGVPVGAELVALTSAGLQAGRSWWGTDGVAWIMLEPGTYTLCCHHVLGPPRRPRWTADVKMPNRDAEYGQTGLRLSDRWRENLRIRLMSHVERVSYEEARRSN